MYEVVGIKFDSSNRLYYFETIEESEKQIIDKAIVADIAYEANAQMLNCFV